MQFEFRISDLFIGIETRGNVEGETDSQNVRSGENLKSSWDVNSPFHSKLKLWLVLISLIHSNFISSCFNKIN